MTDSSALGPNPVSTMDAKHLCGASFSSATIYYPESGTQLPSITMVGGWGCGEQAQAAWAPFYASHGIVAMTIATPKPWNDICEARSKALLDASVALQLENTRTDSVLFGRLDISSRAVQGHSLGGGGSQLAALQDPTLKCSIAICPDDGRVFGRKAPEALSPSVPALILCAEKDSEAPPKKFAWPDYHKTGGTKLIFEVKGGSHSFANGPSGDGKESDMMKGAFDLAVMCNCLSSLLSCGACAPCPCACGVMNGSSGNARANAPRGVVGDVALAWLRLFLLRDESARSQLTTRPGIALNFESSGIETTTGEVMER